MKVVGAAGDINVYRGIGRRAEERRGGEGGRGEKR